MPPSATDPLVDWLLSDAGTGAIASARRASDGAPDALAAATGLRAAEPALTPEQAAAALEQAALRQQAADRYGILAADLLLTRDGLEQASRPEVAAYRAELMRASGVRRVLDLTAGLGFDSAAFTAAGIAVTALERDPRTAAFCARNVPDAHLVTADATNTAILADLMSDLAPTDAVFVDPARRDPRGPRDLSSGRARPERDPERWSPPWSFIQALPHPRVALKAAPAFEPPDGWHATWSSVHRVVVECGAYTWPAIDAERRAVLLAGGQTVELDGTSDELPTASAPGRWLLEPDPAVERAHALAALSRLCVGGLLSFGDNSSWLTCDADPPTTMHGLARCYRVLTDLTGSASQQRKVLAERSIDRLVVKSRDVHADPKRVLRDLGCREGGTHVLVLTRRGGRTVGILTDAAAEPRA